MRKPAMVLAQASLFVPWRYEGRIMRFERDLNMVQPSHDDLSRKAWSPSRVPLVLMPVTIPFDQLGDQFSKSSRNVGSPPVKTTCGMPISKFVDNDFPLIGEQLRMIAWTCVVAVSTVKVAAVSYGQVHAIGALSSLKRHICGQAKVADRTHAAVAIHQRFDAVYVF
jgi:hypothetical protein